MTMGIRKGCVVCCREPIDNKVYFIGEPRMHVSHHWNSFEVLSFAPFFFSLFGVGLVPCIEKCRSAHGNPLTYINWWLTHDGCCCSTTTDPGCKRIPLSCFQPDYQLYRLLQNH